MFFARIFIKVNEGDVEDDEEHE